MTLVLDLDMERESWQGKWAKKVSRDLGTSMQVWGYKRVSLNIPNWFEMRKELEK
jgi:hypothetical protein